MIVQYFSAVCVCNLPVYVSLDTGCVGRVGMPSLTQFSRLGHLVSYSCMCAVCLMCVGEVGFFSSLSFSYKVV